MVRTDTRCRRSTLALAAAGQATQPQTPDSAPRRGRPPAAMDADQPRPHQAAKKKPVRHPGLGLRPAHLPPAHRYALRVRLLEPPGRKLGPPRTPMAHPRPGHPGRRVGRIRVGRGRPARVRLETTSRLGSPPKAADPPKPSHARGRGARGSRERSRGRPPPTSRTSQVARDTDFPSSHCGLRSRPSYWAGHGPASPMASSASPTGPPLAGLGDAGGIQPSAALPDPAAAAHGAPADARSEGRAAALAAETHARSDGRSHSPGSAE